MNSPKQPCWACSKKAHLKKTYIIPLEMDGTDDTSSISVTNVTRSLNEDG